VVEYFPLSCITRCGLAFLELYCISHWHFAWGLGNLKVFQHSVMVNLLACAFTVV
jgi:predicted outer membrane lipoprotein